MSSAWRPRWHNFRTDARKTPDNRAHRADSSHVPRNEVRQRFPNTLLSIERRIGQYVPGISLGLRQGTIERRALKVLIVENNQDSIRSLEIALKEDGFEVVVACNGIEALKVAQAERPDVVLLNPTLAWFGETPTDRKTSSGAELPVILLDTALQESKKLKTPITEAAKSPPLRIEELIDRIKATQRDSASSAEVIHAGAIAMDLGRWMTSVEGKDVALTAKEFRLLRMLIEARGRVLTRHVLLENVWNHEAAQWLDTRTVDIHVVRLRRKLGFSGRYIITVRGVGYRFGVLHDQH